MEGDDIYVTPYEIVRDISQVDLIRTTKMDPYLLPRYKPVPQPIAAYTRQF